MFGRKVPASFSGVVSFFCAAAVGYSVFSSQKRQLRLQVDDFLLKLFYFVGVGGFPFCLCQ